MLCFGGIGVVGDGSVGVGDVDCGSSNSSSQREVNMVGVVPAIAALAWQM